MSDLRGNAAWRALGDDEPESELEASGAALPGEILERAEFFSAQRVAAVALRCKPLDAKDAQRLAIKFLRRNGFGRRGMPHACVRAMYMDYLRLGSASKVGRLYGRSRQSVWDLFSSHKLPLRERKRQDRILFAGVYWTQMKGGYYRPTTGDRSRLLHHEIWKARHGRTIPSGWQVTFKDGDTGNFTQGNLVCLPKARVSLLHYARRYPRRAGMTAAERRAFWRSHNRDYMRVKAAKFVAMGLRCDGKPLRRILRRKTGGTPALRCEAA